MILLDTNVLSERVRPAPAAAVEQSLTDQRGASVVISAITEAEFLYGVAITPRGWRQQALAMEIERMIAEDFGGRVPPFDSVAAVAFAEILDV